MKKINKLLVFLVLLLKLLPAPDPNWVYPGDPTTGAINWSPGDTVQINGLVIFSGATIRAWGNSSSGVTITLAETGQIKVDSTSSLTFAGNAYNTNRVSLVKATSASNHGSILCSPNSVIRISNTLIEDAYRGIQLYTDDAVIDHTEIRNAQSVGFYLNACSPRITRSWVSLSGGQFSIAAVNLPSAPQMFGNYFSQGSQSHISLTTALPSGSLFFEGNYWGGVTPVIRVNGSSFMTSYSANVYPVLSATPWTGTMYLAGVSSGINGTIDNPNFYMFGDDYWGISGSASNDSITIANGANIYMGVSRNVLSSVTYYGNSHILFNGQYNLVLNSGSNLQCRGTVAYPNTIRSAAGGTSRAIWNQLLVNSGATARFDYTTIQNGTVGLSVVSNPTSLTFNTVSVNYNTYGISTNSTQTFSNLYLGGNNYGFRLTGGTPVVRSNRIYGGGTGTETAFQITGGSFPAGNIRSNTLNSTIDAYAASSGATGIVYLEGNYWSANPPVTTNFSGSDVIDYEPWKSATGVNTSLRPTTNLSSPSNGANLAAAPTRLTLNTEEIGMYNDSPITYQLQLDTSPAFTAPTVFTASSQRHWTNISANVSAYSFLIGTRYYWRARSQSSADGLGYGSWSPSWNFIISQPILALSITTNPNVNYASAGATVVYEVSFNYVSTIYSNITNAKVVSCLPDDVYFNGNLTLSGFDTSYLTIVVNAYEDLAGTSSLGSYSGTVSGTLALTNGYSGWVSADNNHRIRRLDVQIGKLDTGDGGYITYGTIVK